MSIGQWLTDGFKASPKNLPPASAVTVAYSGNRGRVGKANVRMFRNWAEHSEWVRAAIDIRKTQASQAEWQILPVDDERPFSQPLTDRITALLRKPNPQNDSFRSFIEPVIEDILVLDAGCVEKVRSLRDEPVELWPVDGGLIRVSATWDGDPEEARYWWYPDQLPRASYRNDELLYMMMKPRTYTPIGLSPLETLKMAIDGELRGSAYNDRQLNQAAPDGMLDLGEGARPNQVEEFKCYADDTEFLTESGWRRYDDIGSSDRLAMVDDAGELHYGAFSDRFEAPYQGPMVHVRGQRGVDLLVTPNHRMVVSDRDGARYRFLDASETVGRQLSIPMAPLAWNCVAPAPVVLETATRVAGTTRGAQPRPVPSIPIRDWLEFVGYLVSDGWVQESDAAPYTVGISQNAGAKAEVIDACLSRLPFHVTRSKKQGGSMVEWRIFSKTLCDWARVEVGIGALQKHLPRNLMSLDREHLTILFDALMLGDGTWSGDHAKYTTASSRLADDVQELALKVGRRAIVSLVVHGSDQWYDVHMADRRAARVLSSKNVEWSGRVVCFTVPTGRLIVRRNGHASICGNSYWSSEIEGKGVMAILGGTKGAKFHQFRGSNRDMQFMEWQIYLIGKICAVFQISRQDLGFTMDINRANGEVVQENTEDRGIRSLLGLTQDYITREIVQDDRFGGPDNNLQFAYTSLNLKESLSKAQINTKALAGLPWKSVNDARRDDGRPPYPEAIFERPMAMTPRGIVVITNDVPTARETLEATNKPPEPGGPPATKMLEEVLA
jgi:hypothetical protein